MRISDWSSDVCSSDLGEALRLATRPERMERRSASRRNGRNNRLLSAAWHERVPLSGPTGCHLTMMRPSAWADRLMALSVRFVGLVRSEEHTSELQSLMRISYAVFCLKKKKLITCRSTHQLNTHT